MPSNIVEISQNQHGNMEFVFDLSKFHCFWKGKKWLYMLQTIKVILRLWVP